MSLFNSDTTLIADAHLIMPLYGLSFVLSAMNITMTVFFLSTKRTAQAVTISFCRSVLFNSLIITLIPIFGSDKLLWSALIFSELLSLAVALILKRKTDKKGMVT